MTHLPQPPTIQKKQTVDYLGEIASVFSRSWDEAERQGWKAMLQLGIDGDEEAYRKCVHAIEKHHGDPEIQLIGTFLDYCVAPARRIYSWAVPSERAIGCLVHHSKTCAGVLEVGAGTGFWAAILASRGADVLAVDDAPPRYNGQEGHEWPLNSQHSLHTKFTFAANESERHERGKKSTTKTSRFVMKNNTGCFYPVNRGGATEAGSHPDRLLFLCWPPAWSVLHCDWLHGQCCTVIGCMVSAAL